MAKRQRYEDGCGMAHALDLVGERWALLIVRELLFGPKRYSDLEAGLRGVSPNVLSRRLRDLEAVGVLRRHRLGPPTSSWVYELTPWGRQLDDVILHLSRWGRRSTLCDRAADSSVEELLLALRARFAPAADAGGNRSYALRIDDDRFAIDVEGGRLEIVRGEARRPDAVIETDGGTLASLFARRQSLDEAVSAGRLRLTGDRSAVRGLLASFTEAEPDAVQSGRSPSLESR